MSKTSKTAKYLLPGRIRKRLGVTSNPENHDYLKKIDVSSSKLVYLSLIHIVLFWRAGRGRGCIRLRGW